MSGTKLKKFLFGSILVSGLAMGGASCSSKDKKGDADSKAKTEVEAAKKQKDPYGNIALFEESRGKIKFALAFVENYYPYIYWCGEAWTAGHGLTILYNANGTYSKVTQNTKVPTLEESDVFKGRYLTHEILPDIRDYIKVPMDQNTLIAACVLRYCIGRTGFKDSQFVKQLNAGKKGEELALTLSGWRKQEGVPKRCYFFAAIMAGKMQFSDLLDLRAEGCYNLKQRDIFVYAKGKPKSVGNGFYEWDYSKVQQNLEKAKKPRKTCLNLGKRKYIHVDCKLTKDVVPDYIWQEVSQNAPRTKGNQQTNNKQVLSATQQNDISYTAYEEQNYTLALNAGKEALRVAETNKQKGAACYNIGIAYLELGKYRKAITYLQQSLAFNQTNAAKKALETAQQKHRHSRNKTLVYLGLGALGCGGAAYCRKRNLTQRPK